MSPEKTGADNGYREWRDVHKNTNAIILPSIIACLVNPSLPLEEHKPKAKCFLLF